MSGVVQRYTRRSLLTTLALTGTGWPQQTSPPPAGKVAYDAFTAWRAEAGYRADQDWDKAIAAYRSKLQTARVAAAEIERRFEAIYAYGEAELYDNVYAGKPDFQTRPNQLLVDAVKGRKPGKALDVAMGQGRNSIFLASQGWDVTGFDVSAAGLRAARHTAASRGLRNTTVHSSDQDFDFGRQRWDLIALLYSIEKRSIHRVRDALKPGGMVVVEAGHKSASGAPFEYESGELPRIFAGLRIVRYEEPVAKPDWGDKPIRLVRLMAER